MSVSLQSDLSEAVRGDLPESPPVLDLIVRRVRLRVRRRAAWLSRLRGDLVQDREPTVLEVAIDDRDRPEAELCWLASADEVADLGRRLEEVEGALAGEGGAPLQQLAALFRLSAAETDLLQACVALSEEPALGTLYGFLQGGAGRAFVTERLAARLFEHGSRRLWRADSPLAVWGLVSEAEAAPGEPAPLVCDPQVVDWLQGRASIDSDLVGVAVEIPQRRPLPGWPVAELEARVRRALENGGVRLVLSGVPGSGRRTLASCVAGRIGLPALAVDCDQIADADWPELFMRVQRLAVLWRAAVVWHGSSIQRKWPRHVGPAPLQFLVCDDDEVVAEDGGLVDYRFDLPLPGFEERQRLWSEHVPESAAWPQAVTEALVARHRLTLGDIEAVGRSRPSGPAEASRLCRELTRERLGDLGRLLECPFDWDDLVLPDRLRGELEEFAFEARERERFWERPEARRLFPRGTALVGLLSGPPGTGKTMAVQVIAAELELDLFRIDLATAVSKYIGETAKNLKRIFHRAARMNAVLLFDEADALFSKRTDVRDAHDRYANTDTNYLLQLLEEYRGIALLATNKKGNIDPAFTRRVRYLFDFPRPTEELRRRIWERVVGELAGAELAGGLEPAFRALAASVKLSGAQIKNAVLAAVFAAQRDGKPLAMPHLLVGVARELSKEGRLLPQTERERLTGHA